jgi:hypothetical protein
VFVTLGRVRMRLFPCLVRTRLNVHVVVINYFHRFDRGVVFNTLEFWGVPGFAVDYTKCFELPTPDTRRSKYTLTQENIMRYSNSSQAQLLPAHGGNAHTSG